MITALLIEDDPNGLQRAIKVARSQNLIPELMQYLRTDINVVWVKSYNEFVNYITTNGIPDQLWFDHDLNDVDYQLYHKNGGYQHKDIDYSEYKEKTGFHCADWLVNYCLDNNLILTSDIYAHSMNVKGRENIKGILNNFKKFQAKENV